MRGMGIDQPTLLTSAQVRTELKVNEDQAKKIEAIVTAHREEARALRTTGRNMRDLTPEERTKAREEQTKKRTALLKKTETKFAAVLDKAQMKRLKEITLQQQGIRALTSEPVVASLKITKEQTEKIRAAMQANATEMREMMQSMRGGGGDRTQMREKMAALRKKGETAVLAVLSKEQQAGFDKLKGAKFELDRTSIRRGGGRQRTGGAGGRRGQRGGAGGAGGGGAI